MGAKARETQSKLHRIYSDVLCRKEVLFYVEEIVSNDPLTKPSKFRYVLYVNPSLHKRVEKSLKTKLRGHCFYFDFAEAKREGYIAFNNLKTEIQNM